MKEILESQLENKEMKYILQQVKEVEIPEDEKIIEDLGEVEQEASSIIKDNSTPSDIGDLVEASSIECETDVEVQCAQSPIHILINEEELEEDKQVKIEESCQEVEVIKEESKGVKFTLSKPSDIFLAKSPSILQIEWVIILSFNFLGLYQYVLLETDGKLRALYGLESKKELDISWQLESRCIVDRNSNFGVRRWSEAQFIGFRMRIKSSKENSKILSPEWKHEDQEERVLTNKVCDPRIHINNHQSWGLITCFRFLGSVVCII
ncbi:hypothetical protein Ahy_B08g091480 [Arachis hypogaea]|uniref:Uncharacterized protein n=1 Tax=Arachis hypogaea TaxID=3818 RepID=A0A444Y275_ARAHY|nr:hypothetical protein Ahy_B08g091480 [Arachis hypogaea]